MEESSERVGRIGDREDGEGDLGCSPNLTDSRWCGRELCRAEGSGEERETGSSWHRECAPMDFERIARIPLVKIESVKIPLVKTKVSKYHSILVFHAKIPLVTN